VIFLLLSLNIRVVVFRFPTLFLEKMLRQTAVNKILKITMF